MKDSTKLAFSQQVFTPMAQTYGVNSVHESFSVSPTHVQTMNDKIVEQSTFLPRINVMPVDEMVGEKIFGAVNKPITSRTDTSGKNERQPQHPLELSNTKYSLVQTNTDVAIRYATLDSWAKFKDLAERFQRYVFARTAADRELIGWNGIKTEVNSDSGTYPLLQDVNKGWMQLVREAKPENIMASGKNDGEVRVGKGGDYSCLDVVVNDLLQGIPYYKRHNLVALIGRELVAAEDALLFEAVQGTPTEKAAMSAYMKKYGGLDWESPSFFPERGLVITSLPNLSLYYQDSSWRRHIMDNPKKDQLEDYNSRNEGYVVEDVDLFVALEFSNVKLPVLQDDGSVVWE